MYRLLSHCFLCSHPPGANIDVWFIIVSFTVEVTSFSPEFVPKARVAGAVCVRVGVGGRGGGGGGTMQWRPGSVFLSSFFLF